VLAIGLGVRFTLGLIRMAPSWIVSVAFTTVAMILLCVGFAWLLSWASGLPWAKLMLGVAPCGIAGMSITAKILLLGVPLGRELNFSRYFRMSPTRHAVIPGEIFIGDGNSPLRQFRQSVDAENGASPELSSGF